MLFWIIAGYMAVLGVCFLVGEYLKDCRIAKKQKESSSKALETEPEVTPSPRQTAQMLSRDVQRLAEELAEQFGLDAARVQDYFNAATADCPLPPQTEIVDLEEQPPQG